MAYLSFTKVILGWMSHKPATRLYPFVKREPYKNTRGHIEIDINTCIFCSLCQKKCPSAAITVEKNEKKWSINRLRCIQCNACVEVCPKKCLSMANTYTSPITEKTIDIFIGPKPDNAPKEASTN